MSDCPHWQRPSLVEMTATTAIPVVGIAAFGWNGLDVLLLCWFENAIVGVFSVLRLALSKPVYAHRADYIAAHPWILQHYPISEEEWERAKSWPVPQYPTYKEFFIPLFIGHYTFFLAVHAFLLATLVRQLPAKAWWTLFPAEWSSGMALAVASIAATHAWRFKTDDLQGRRHTRSCPFLTMVHPYRRLLILNITLFLGGLAFVWFSLPATLAILLILLKSAFELNWIRIPFGPKQIDWRKMGDKERERGNCVIVGRTVTEKPADCRIVLEESPAALLLTVPPHGVRNVARKMRAGGCLVVGLFLVGMASFFSVGILLNLWRTIADGGTAYWLVLLAMTGTQIVGTLWLLMFFMLVSIPWSVLAYGTVRGEIELRDGRLRIRQRGFPCGRSGDYAAADVVDLGMSPTGNRTNEFPVLQLRLRLKNGSEHTFFTGRDEDELNWMATRLVMRLADS